MSFFTEEVVWIVMIAVVLQIIKMVYHWRLLWVMKKKKSKSNRYRSKLKSIIVDKI